MALDFDIPQGPKGILIIIGLLIVAITALKAAAFGTVVFALILVVAAGYLLVVVLGRLHDNFRHGKPLLRRRARKQQQQGGEK